MKMEEIKQLPLEELEVQLQDLKEEMQNLKFQQALHQIDNPLKVRALRRDIARFNTVIHEYDLGLRTDQKAQA